MIYPALRWAGVQQRLRPWARRLSIGMALTLLVTAGGASDLASALASASGLAAWSLMPWFWLSAAYGAWAAVLVYALVAGLWGLLLCPWLLPTRWLDAERQLPIAPAARWRSDAAVAGYALLPVWGLQALGLLSWLHGSGLQPTSLLLGLPLAGLLGLGLVVLALVRRRALPKSSPQRRREREAQSMPSGRLPASWVLLALPLWRGPWRRSARWLLLSSTALLVPAGLAKPGQGAVWMALWVLLAGVAVQRAAALLRDEGAALEDALASLPLEPARWVQARQLLALLPLLPSALAWTAAGLSWRAPVLAGFLLVLGLGGAWVALQRLELDEYSAIRALLLLTLLVALGTESLA